MTTSRRARPLCCAVAFIAFVAVITACHHDRPHRPGEEWLESVEFQGNQQISDDDLLTGLAVHRAQKAGRAPDLYQVQLDTDRLKGQYAREGFFEADVQSRIDRQQDAATVVYTIREGQRSVTRVTISGLPDDPALPVQAVRAKMPIADGAPFNYEIYDKAKVDVLGVVQDAGYAHAKLDATVRGDVATHTAFVDLVFTTGPKCKFGKIDIAGIDGDLKGAIVDRLHFQSGDIYSNRAITRTQRDLYALGRFSTVQISPADGDSDVVDMKVAVSESAAHQVTLGGGIGIDPISYEVRGRAGYEVAGWPFPLDKVTIDLRPAYAYLRDGSGFEPRMRAVTRLERQDLFTTYAVGSVEVGYNYLAYEAFTEYGPQAQLGYELRLWSPKLKLRAGYLIHRYDFRNPSELLDPALIQMLGIDHTELVGAYQASISADFRDHPVEPRWGVYGEIKVTEGTKYAGGDYDYHQIVPELRAYAPIGPVVIAARARYGALYGEIPPTERFYAGGATSQRGFAEREMSPSVTGQLMDGSRLTVPYGGGGLIDSSIEARIPLVTIKKMPLGLVTFLDGGDVTERPGDLDLANLNWAAGLGLRLLTVVGPVRADVGYRLNRKGPDDPQPGSSYAFHLSLGEAF